MYGPGAGPPRRESDGATITLRVLFPALSVLTCGILACAPLFRIAILRGRPLDWILAVASLPVNITLFAIIGSLPESDPRTDVALAILLLIALGSAVYFLVYDIRRTSAPLPVNPYAPTTPSSAYGHPQPGPHPRPQPHPQQSWPAPPPPPQQHAMPTQTMGAPTPTPAPAPPPAPPQNQAPPPHRIDQVRAELDELSDYLRKQDGGR
ncbi:hypothetical protein ACYBSK_02900 [Streptomyces sp. BYX5S]